MNKPKFPEAGSKRAVGSACRKQDIHLDPKMCLLRAQKNNPNLDFVHPQVSWKVHGLTRGTVEGGGTTCTGSSALLPFLFWGEGSPTKIGYRKKGTLILTSLLEDLGLKKRCCICRQKCSRPGLRSEVSAYQTAFRGHVRSSSGCAIAHASGSWVQLPHIAIGRLRPLNFLTFT